jgi:hypothetical protein
VVVVVIQHKSQKDIDAMANVVATRRNSICYPDTE